MGCIRWLVGWLVDWWIHGLVGRLVKWLVNWLFGWLVCYMCVWSVAADEDVSRLQVPMNHVVAVKIFQRLQHLNHVPTHTHERIAQVLSGR